MFANQLSPQTSCGRILRIRDVSERVGFSKSQIYKLVGRGMFPKGFKLSARATGWLETDVEGWIQSRINRNQLAD